MASSANVSKVRSADLHSPKMLQVARMSGLVKLRCSGGHLGERQLWAVNDGIETSIRVCRGHASGAGYVHLALRHAVQWRRKGSFHLATCTSRSFVKQCPNRPPATSIIHINQRFMPRSRGFFCVGKMHGATMVLRFECPEMIGGIVQLRNAVRSG